MYYVDRRIHRHQKFRKRAMWAVALLLVFGATYGLVHLRLMPQQDVQSSPPTSKAYKATPDTIVTVNKPELTFELPSGWTEESIAQTVSSPRYSFRSASTDARQLQIYIDNPPRRFGLNRAIVVSPVGDSIVASTVSDNCTTYTDGSKRDESTGFAPAKWQGIDFYCDVANYARAVVGTVSKDGFNYVNVTEPKFGTHKLFITYIDNNISPDYTTLYNIVNSPHFK